MTITHTTRQNLFLYVNSQTIVKPTPEVYKCTNFFVFTMQVVDPFYDTVMIEQEHVLQRYLANKIDVDIGNINAQGLIKVVTHVELLLGRFYVITIVVRFYFHFFFRLLIDGSNRRRHHLDKHINFFLDTNYK